MTGFNYATQVVSLTGTVLQSTANSNFIQGGYGHVVAAVDIPSGSDHLGGGILVDYAGGTTTSALITAGGNAFTLPYSQGNVIETGFAAGAGVDASGVATLIGGTVAQQQNTTGYSDGLAIDLQSDTAQIISDAAYGSSLQFID